MWIMGLTVAGMSAVDWMSSNFLQLTMRKFTANVFLISLLIGSFNRMFGFVVQPFVAWKSDQIGRRRPFYLIGNPITLVSLLMLGAMPMIFRGEMLKHVTLILVCMWVLNIMLQAFMDFSTGALDPLFADSFKQQKLGRAAAIRGYCGMMMTLSMSLLVLPFYQHIKAKWGEDNFSHFIPYAFAGLWVSAGWLTMKFLVKEKPAPPRENKENYNPIAHFSMLANPDYLKLATIAALGLCLPATTTLFQPLFITQTLGLDAKQMGMAIGWAPFVTLVLSFPLGYLADRFGPRYLLAFGFFGIAGTNIAMSYYVHSFHTLFAVSLVGAGLGMFSQLPMTAMIFQYASRKERGTIFGLIQFIRAFSAFSISLVVGFAVQNSRSGDATKIYDIDVAKPDAIAGRLLQPKDEFERTVAERIPPELIKKIRTAKNTEDKKDAIAQALNVVMDGRNIYSSIWADHKNVSRFTRRLAANYNGSDPAQTKLVNRSLMEDMFSGDLSPKKDFRLGYVFNIVVALLAGFLSLTTRPGKYARTLKQKDLVEE